MNRYDVERGADAMIQRQLDRHLDSEYSDVELEEAYEAYVDGVVEGEEPDSFEVFCDRYERPAPDADYDPYDSEDW